MSKKNIYLIGIIVLIFLLLTIFITYVLMKNKENYHIHSNKQTEIGIIKEIIKSGKYGTIFIERENYKAYVTIDEKTIITRPPLSRSYTFDDLKLGNKVKVTVPEIIMEIYPYKFTTEHIDILE